MPQAGQEATSTDKPITKCPKNMSEDIDPHIIGITESWANTDITDAELWLTGYVMFRRDRIGRRGGVVILYVKESIQAYEIN